MSGASIISTWIQCWSPICATLQTMVCRGWIAPRHIFFSLFAHRIPSAWQAVDGMLCPGLFVETSQPADFQRRTRRWVKMLEQAEKLVFWWRTKQHRAAPRITVQEPCQLRVNLGIQISTYGSKGKQTKDGEFEGNTFTLFAISFPLRASKQRLWRKKREREKKEISNVLGLKSDVAQFLITLHKPSDQH